MNPVLVFLVLLLFSIGGAAQEVGTLTLREGGLRILRGTAVLKPAEGMRLRQGDILESFEPGFAQMEFTNGAVVAMGPSTRLYLASQGKAAAQLMLLSGWLKGQSAATAGRYQYLTPLLAASTREGTLVLHATPERTEGFVESGSATVGGADAQAGSAVKAGQFLSRSRGKKVALSARMPAEFVQAMPSAFKDTLPPRLSHFAGKRIEPATDHQVAYSEVQSWLVMPPAWRKGLVHRFQPRLSDPAFRKSVEANLDKHPEWDPVLHPEKYQHKAPNGEAGAQQRGRLPQ